MKKQAVKVCVIVPVYNVAPYLARCLDSLVFQTLRDIEIICVDDKSTDNSLEILREYEKKDPRIRVIALKQNGGVAAARNAGIAAARGEYLGFVDSDDYVDLDFFETLYNAAKESGSDMARGNVKITQYDGTVFKDRHEIRDVQKKGKWHFSWQWWCAIYRTRMINDNNIRFLTDISNGEDTVFLTTCVSCANSLVACPNVFYNYIRREDSLDEPMMSPPKVNSLIKAYLLLADIYNSSNEISDDDYIARYVWVIGSVRDKIYRNTSKKIHHDIAAAAIEIFKRCKKKSAVANVLGKCFGKHFSECMQSYDVDGVADLWHTIVTNSESKKCDINKKLYLFGFIPVARFLRTDHKMIIRVFGVQLVRTKNEYGTYRLYFLYVPIIKVRSK